MTALPHRNQPMIILTADERKLLHQLHGHLGYIVASPKEGIEHLKQSHASGGGQEFVYTAANYSLQGQWRRYEVIERLKDGSPSRLRFDEPHLEALITWSRLRQWATRLPEELRERALTAWRTYPVDTRDLGELARIVNEAIELSAPMEQLELFPEPQAVAS